MKDWTFRVTGQAHDVSNASIYMLSGSFDTTTGTVDLFFDSPNGLKTPISSTNPFTWAEGDQLLIQGSWMPLIALSEEDD